GTAADHAPGHLAPVPVLQLLRDLDPPVPGGFPERGDPALLGGCPIGLRCAVLQRGHGQRTDNDDLVSIDGYLGPPGEPVVRQGPGDPGGGIVGRWRLLPRPTAHAEQRLSPVHVDLLAYVATLITALRRCNPREPALRRERTRDPGHDQSWAWYDEFSLTAA